MVVGTRTNKSREVKKKSKEKKMVMITMMMIKHFDNIGILVAK